MDKTLLVESGTGTKEGGIGLTIQEAFKAGVVFLVLLLFFFRHSVIFGQALLPVDLIYSLDPVWSPYAPAGFHAASNPLLSDQVFQGYPWRAYVYYWLSQGQLPLWNSSLLSGVSLVGNAQSALFYPLNLLSYFLPLTTSFSFLAVSRLLIACLSTYCYLRITGRSKGAGYLGGVAFGLSGFLIAWLGYPIVNVAVLLPTILLFLELVFQSRRPLWTILLAFSVGTQFLGGHPETSFHVLLAAGAYALFLFAQALRQKRIGPAWRGVAFAALGGLVGLGLGSIQIFPFIEQLTKSNTALERASVTGATSALFYPDFWKGLATVPTWLFPTVLGSPTDAEYWAFPTNFNEYSAYVGTIPLLLALIGGATFRRDGRIAFWLAVGFFSLTVAYRLPLFELFNHLPLFELVNNGRLRLIGAFAAVVLAAAGMDWFLGRLALSPVEKKQQLKPLLWLCLVVAVAVPLFSASIYLLLLVLREDIISFGRRFVEANVFGQPNFPFPLDYYLVKVDGFYEVLVGRFWPLNWQTELPAISALVLAVMAWLAGRGKLNPRLAPLILVGVTASELVVLGAGYNPSIDAGLVYPKTPAVQFLIENAGTERVAGLDFALNPNSAMNWGLQDVRGYENVELARSRSLLRQIKGREEFGGYLLLRSAESPLLGLLGVRYIIARQDAFPADRSGLIPVFTDGKVTILENQRALPRAYVVGQASALADPADILDRVSKAAFNARAEVLLETSQNPPVEGLISSTSEIRFVSDRPNDVTLDVSLDGDGYLVLTDAYDDGWTASVDSQPTAVFRANYAFRAVRLAAGNHIVEFTYRPKGLVWGTELAIISFVSTMLMALSLRFRRR